MMEEQLANSKGYEITGNFEIDYLECCRIQAIKPFALARLGMPLPPLPNNVSNHSNQQEKKEDTKEHFPMKDFQSKDNLKSKDHIRSKEIGTSKDDRISESHNDKNTSKFKFTPTLYLETNEDDDELYKIEIRGWKIPHVMMDILGSSIPVCATITNLVLWNCNITDALFPAIVNICNNSNIRSLSLDQNPLISETLFANLLSDENNLKSLSLRSNNIGDLGAKNIGISLKTNHSLLTLSLWDNLIQKEGAETIADALRVNQMLASLSLGKNMIGNEGAISFAMILSNSLLSSDEIQLRKKLITDLEKQKQEDKSKKNARIPAVKNALKIDETKDAIKGKPIKKKPDVAPVAKTPKTPEDPRIKKVADDKTKKDKRSASLAVPAVSKPKKPTKEELENDEDPVHIWNIEPMYEINGQWCILGNRTLTNLDLSFNKIGEVGVKALFDAINAQELANDQASDGFVGLYRLGLFMNQFDFNNFNAVAIENILKNRNPFFDNTENDDRETIVSQSQAGSLAGDDAGS